MRFSLRHFVLQAQHCDLLEFGNLTAWLMLNPVSKVPLNFRQKFQPHFPKKLFFHFDERLNNRILRNQQWHLLRQCPPLGRGNKRPDRVRVDKIQVQELNKRNL